MIKICEMQNTEWFKLSTGEVAFVGLFEPNVQYYLPQCRAKIIVNNDELQELSILGEDKLVRSDRAEFEGKRSVRTTDEVLQIPEDADVRIVFYE